MGSPGRGWGGARARHSVAFVLGFPRARVGWRVLGFTVNCNTPVPPGAGGVAFQLSWAVILSMGSPGRGWGGVDRRQGANLRWRFPRARVGWRLTGGAGPRARRVPPGAGGVAIAIIRAMLAA